MVICMRAKTECLLLYPGGAERPEGVGLPPGAPPRRVGIYSGLARAPGGKTLLATGGGGGVYLVTLECHTPYT